MRGRERLGVLGLNLRVNVMVSARPRSDARETMSWPFWRNRSRTRNGSENGVLCDSETRAEWNIYSIQRAMKKKQAWENARPRKAGRARKDESTGRRHRWRRDHMEKQGVFGRT